MTVCSPRDTRLKRFIAATKMQPLGVFLASANKAQIEALNLVIQQQQGAQIVGGAVDTHGVLESILECPTDILLLDWERSTFWPVLTRSILALSAQDFASLLCMAKAKRLCQAQICNCL